MIIVEINTIGAAIFVFLQLGLLLHLLQSDKCCRCIDLLFIYVI